MTTPSRLVPLSGTTNFRDLGGYVGHDGRLVQWRKLFRSDHLGALTSDDIVMLSDLGLARVADFRGADERQQQACAMPSLTVDSLPIDPSVVQSMKASSGPGCLNNIPPSFKWTPGGLPKVQSCPWRRWSLATNRPTRWATRGAPGISFYATSASLGSRFS